ncbi:porin [Enterovibrio paralichthyis]|uniref:porin n=1 Tax=Enterovibrio paralichthyis TaxID=2853805 RepID=UPI001C48F969|nr:porin [Enterovibrio paralichthyis]MBV7300648.1 porin [Enterovibrio paralichthyis]
MNKKLIALAVAAVASTSVSAAEIFNDGTSSLSIGGRAEARASMIDGDVNDASRVRLNVMGTTQISEEVYGVGFFEREFKSNEGDDENRYIFAGIGSQYGLVTYGLNDGSLGIITDFTDIMAYHGAAASGKILVADRTDNNFAYVGEFGGLTVKANYVFDTSETVGNTKTTKVGGYSAAATYAMENGVAFGLGYADQGKDTNEASQVEAAVSYTFGDIYVAALYNNGEAYNKDHKKVVDVDGYELAAAYSMGNTTFTTTYGNKEEANEKAANALAIDATHFFNDNFRAYVSYNFNMLDAENGMNAEDKLKTEDELALGLRYDF